MRKASTLYTYYFQSIIHVKRGRFTHSKDILSQYLAINLNLINRQI